VLVGGVVVVVEGGCPDVGGCVEVGGCVVDVGGVVVEVEPVVLVVLVGMSVDAGASVLGLEVPLIAAANAFRCVRTSIN